MSNRVILLLLITLPRYGSRVWQSVYLSVCLSVCLSDCLCVCLSASISLEPLDRSSTVVVAQFSSGGIVIRYVLPVLWMMSHLAVVCRVVMHG